MHLLKWDTSAGRQKDDIAALKIDERYLAYNRLHKKGTFERSNKMCYLHSMPLSHFHIYR